MRLRADINPDLLQPKRMWEFVMHARERRRSLVASLDASLKRYVGPLMYSGETTAGGPDSHEFEVASLFIPQLVIDSPRAKVTTLRRGAARFAARCMQHGLNRWSQQNRIEDRLEELAFSFLMRTGRAHISLEREPNASTTRSFRNRKVFPQRPRISSVSPRRTLDDPIASNDDEKLFEGHEYVTSIAELVGRAKTEPGWDTGRISRLRPDTGLLELRPTDRGTGPERDDTGIAELWVPKYLGSDEHAAGMNGLIYTISLAEPPSGNWEDVFLREPRPGFTSEHGPYVDFGAYYVLDDTTRLSPIVAVLAQVEHRQKHEAAASRRAGRHKRIAAIDAISAESGTRLNDAEDGEVVVVDGVDKAHLIEMELGGISDATMAYLAFLRQKLDRSSSMDDTQRGSVTGVGTATENELAFQATATRIGYLRRRFAKATRNVFAAAGHLLFYSERCVFPLGEDAAGEMGAALQLLGALGLTGTSAAGPVIMPPEPWFMGGSFPGNGFSLNDLEVDIEVESLGRTSNAERAAQMQLAAFAVNTAALRPQLPFVQWEKFDEWIGELHNYPRFRELFDYKALGQMPMQPDPRYAGDVGVQSSRPPAGARGGSRFAGVASQPRQPTPIAPQAPAPARANGPSKPSQPGQPRAARAATQIGGTKAKTPKAGA